MRRSTKVSSRYKALAVLATAAVLITGCSSKKSTPAAASSTPAAPAATSSAAPAPAATTSAAAGPIKITLITKATGGFWDAMIAGAKKYQTDNPTQVDISYLACKTND